MIVVCTGCGAKFKVADEKVGPKGAKLRCSKCQAVFTVRREPPPDAAGPAAHPPSPPPLPSRRDPGEGAGPGAAPSGRGLGPSLDARSAFEIDLEPAPPRGAAPDPFAALAPPEDPFGNPLAGAAPLAPPPQEPAGPFGAAAGDGDPFAAVQAPIPPELLRGPPAPRAAPAGPTSGAGEDPFAALPPYGGQAPPNADLALEERTTPRPRLARPQTSAPLDDPFYGSAEPGHEGIDGGQPGDIPPLSSAFPGEPFVGFTGAFSTAAPEPAPPPQHEAPLREDPFAAAAVDADPLRVAPPPARAPLDEEEPEAGHPGRVPPRPGRLRAAALNAISLILMLAVTLVLLVIWRGGVPLSEALHPGTFLAALGQRGPDAGPYQARQVTSGLYERLHGAPLLFVRGAVVSRAQGPVAAIRVAVDVVRSGSVVAHGEGRAGAVLTPEELHQATDAASLARLTREAAARAPAQVRPGESVPFLVVIDDYPSELQGASLRVIASDGDGP